MKKNFIQLKTGHKASDEFFKNVPAWHDVDILKFFIFGLCMGSILTVAIHLFVLHLW